MTQQKKICLTVLSILFSLRPAARAAAAFQTAQNYPVGTNPRAVAVADFDRDGKMDLAVANFGDPSVNDRGSVSILLGNGDGTFQPANNVVAGKNPSSITVGDFNEDGRVDIVTVNGDNTVSSLLGNGDGTFQAHVEYGTGSEPDFVAVGDFNSDGRPDLVVTNKGGNSVSVLLGNGDGTFRGHVDYQTGGPAYGVAVADFNGDGKADLAVAGGSISGTVAILIGNGDGTFQSAVSYDPSGTGISVAVGDFNSDGKSDLVVGYAHFGNLTLSDVDLLLGNGDGTFSFGSTLKTGVCHNEDPITADFDGDGKLDLAVIGGFSEREGICTSPGLPLSVLVLAGNGDGTFQAPVSFTPVNGIVRAAASDLDANKSPDLVTVNNDHTVGVLLNTVGTEFSISASAASPSSVRRGESSTSTVTLMLLNAFDNPVSLSCSVQPAQANSPSCSLSSNSVLFDSSGKATATLTITAGSGAVALRVSHPYYGDSHPFSGGWLPVVAAFGLVGTLLVCGYSRRRRFLLFVGCALAGLIFLAACGGGSTGPKSVNYAITVTGTSGSMQHSTTTTLTVQ
jgi:hypothetical protein